MSDAQTVVVIGAGPRGVGWLERFVENHRRDGGPPVDVHLVDPFPPGPGRLWRHDQSPRLMLNSLAEDVTMFTDETSVIEGPVVPGPSLAEWADDIRGGRITDVVATDPELADELARFGHRSFPTRRLQSLYLDWFHRRTVSRLPDGVTVTSHRARATTVDDLPDGRQRVELDTGDVTAADVAAADVTADDETAPDEIVADAVVYALGHSGSEPDREQGALVDFARRKGVFYLPPSFTADADLSAVGPGETVIVRGFGLAAIDLIVLLGEGRGGRFEPVGSDGAVCYRPSGREPHVVIGSGRGVPYHSKVTSSIVGERPQPRYFTPEIAVGIAAAHPQLDFREHVFPAIAKELLHGYYAELFTGHPDRVHVPWAEFARRFDPLDPFGDDLRALVAEAVVDDGDRLDLLRFDRPLADVQGVSEAELQQTVRAYIRDDLTHRTLPEHSATLGLLQSLLGAFGALFAIGDSPNWTAASRERDLGGGWLRWFSYVASGPPGPRLEQILALSEAGVITFLGAGFDVEADEEGGVFRARSTSADFTVTARALVDAWLPAERVTATDNAALRSLIDGGFGVEHVVSDGVDVARTGKLRVVREDARILRPDGSPHPRRFAIGPFTSAPFVGAFSRPRTNALAFRDNDAVARAVLAELSAAPLNAADRRTTSPAEAQGLART
ncbi:FAD/NAD(P)-binding domain-containing protein [Frondihabitans sp. PAMC 28766]|uniref:FAD/NAD(P)-binding protein n=1 Tax=Frondihabitans sp. PAMC 28766 TaxID=1795630 RepID=UPI0009E80612|nr:FAD/NAD(P)-binding protein [Frondihabitans sp. PAMC 28766]